MANIPVIDKKLSRRQFVGAAAAGAAVLGVVAGSGSLITKASPAGAKVLDPTSAANTTIPVQDSAGWVISTIPSSWNQTADVVVVGAGGAGLNAAIGALEAGAKVIVLEKAVAVGGTTATAGGAVWIPNNYLSVAAGPQYTTTIADMVEYWNAISFGETNPDLMNTYLEQGPAWAAHMNPTYNLKMSYDPGWADYYDKPGLSTYGNMLIPSGEGAYFIGALNAAVKSLGGTVMLSTPATALYQNASGAVVGVQATTSTGTISIGANKGVILCAGGFDWNLDMMANYMRGPVDYSAAPITNTGDGVLMAMQAGAWLRNMNNAWHQPQFLIPGATVTNPITGATESGGVSPVLYLGLRPGTIVVNSLGNRFFNESTSYPAAGRAFEVWDTGTEDYINQPAYAICDSVAYSLYGIAGLAAGAPVPSWLTQANTLADLAMALNIDSAGLQNTVATFNTYAANGVDPDFHRGEGNYDMHNVADTSRTQLSPSSDMYLINGCLGRISTPPFYGVQLHSAIIGTCGGPVVNANGQILNFQGNPIPGLYGAGNDVAAIGGYPGGGGTIGPASVIGYIAGKSAATS